MKNTTISAGNIVTLNREETIKLPFDINMTETSIVLKKGVLGKVTKVVQSLHEVHFFQDVSKVIVEFNLCYGVAVKIAVHPDNLKRATDEQVECYCGNN